MTDEAPVALDLLRRQLAALVSQIDTLSLPYPDKRHGPRHARPGCEWAPGKGWRVFTVENEPEAAPFVYLDHACDDLKYRFGEPGDWEAMSIEDARRIGMAFLAAAARAEERLAGVARMDAFRRRRDDDQAEASAPRPLRPAPRPGA